MRYCPESEVLVCLVFLFPWKIPNFVSISNIYTHMFKRMTRIVTGEELDPLFDSILDVFIVFDLLVDFLWCPPNLIKQIYLDHVSQNK